MAEVLLLPDLSAAIALYLKDSITIGAAIDTDNIFQNWPKNLKVPPLISCILIQTGRGGRGDIGMGQQEERVDIFCYAPDRLNAHILWRKLDPYLVDPLARRKTNFIRANTRVTKVEREGGALRLFDTSRNDWPFTSSTYIFTYSSEPVT